MMNKGKNVITKEAMAAVDAAKAEAPFMAKDLLQEIVPLLQAYFMGEVRYSDDIIHMDFYNGQKFVIGAIEQEHPLG